MPGAGHLSDGVKSEQASREGGEGRHSNHGEEEV
jgi:hypothetical protein